MTGTGLKKCMPTTCGRRRGDTAAASRVIEIELVLLPMIARAGRSASSSAEQRPLDGLVLEDGLDRQRGADRPPPRGTPSPPPGPAGRPTRRRPADPWRRPARGCRRCGRGPPRRGPARARRAPPDGRPRQGPGRCRGPSGRRRTRRRAQVHGWTVRPWRSAYRQRRQQTVRRRKRVQPVGGDVTHRFVHDRRQGGLAEAIPQSFGQDAVQLHPRPCQARRVRSGRPAAPVEGGQQLGHARAGERRRRA